MLCLYVIESRNIYWTDLTEIFQILCSPQNFVKARQLSIIRSYLTIFYRTEDISKQHQRLSDPLLTHQVVFFVSTSYRKIESKI